MIHIYIYISQCKPKTTRTYDTEHLNHFPKQNRTEKVVRAKRIHCWRINDLKTWQTPFNTFTWKYVQFTLSARTIQVSINYIHRFSIDIEKFGWPVDLVISDLVNGIEIDLLKRVPLETLSENRYIQCVRSFIFGIVRKFHLNQERKKNWRRSHKKKPNIRIRISKT